MGKVKGLVVGLGLNLYFNFIFISFKPYAIVLLQKVKCLSLSIEVS